jgi:L-alanine-DL-glutamate epimerase-like enolase superfamily enzyme
MLEKRDLQQPVEELTVSAFNVPTDAPEADGTFAWRQTTLVVVHASAGGVTGLGYSYADTSTAQFIDAHLKGLVKGASAFDVPANWEKMGRAVRNLGRPGVSSMAIAAVDNALWDLKARLLDLPLVTLLGAARERVPVYGSGVFTSYSLPALQKQLAGWVEDGIHAVKMKVGSQPGQDVARVAAARKAIGDEAALFVDANGAYSRKQAAAFADHFREHHVTWFEEPVTSDDLEGLRLLRDRAPSGMDIAAGEYGYDLVTFRRMLDAGAVDVLQADATRCGGITGFLRVAALCDAWNLPLSAHCGPSLHCHVCCSAPRVRHVEYFHDHARIERLLFDGAAAPVEGCLVPDLTRPGMGLELKRSDASRYAV